jgi:hypothetical protein
MQAILCTSWAARCLKSLGMLYAFVGSLADPSCDALQVATPQTSAENNAGHAKDPNNAASLPPRPPLQGPASTVNTIGKPMEPPTTKPAPKRLSMAQVPSELRYGTHALASITTLLSYQNASSQLARFQQSVVTAALVTKGQHKKSIFSIAAILESRGHTGQQCQVRAAGICVCALVGLLSQSLPKQNFRASWCRCLASTNMSSMLVACLLWLDPERSRSHYACDVAGSNNSCSLFNVASVVPAVSTLRFLCPSLL